MTSTYLVLIAQDDAARRSLATPGVLGKFGKAQPCYWAQPPISAPQAVSTGNFLILLLFVLLVS